MQQLRCLLGMGSPRPEGVHRGGKQPRAAGTRRSKRPTNPPAQNLQTSACVPPALLLQKRSKTTWRRSWSAGYRACRAAWRATRSWATPAQVRRLGTQRQARTYALHAAATPGQRAGCGAERAAWHAQAGGSAPTAVPHSACTADPASPHPTSPASLPPLPSPALQAPWAPPTPARWAASSPLAG